MALTLTIEENQTDTGPTAPLRGGRPSLYKPEYAQIAKGAVLFGANQRQLVELFNITEPTLFDWIERNPEFGDALRLAEHADYVVMGAFYKRSIGYDVTTRRTTTRRRVRGGRETVMDQEIIETTTHIPADIGAAKQWLRLRRAWGESPVLDLDALFKFAEAARAEAAYRGHDFAASGPPAIEAGDGGSGTEADAGSEAA